MKSNHDNKDGLLKSLCFDSDISFLDQDNIIDFVDDGLFHVNNCYEETPSSTIFCKVCGGNVFNVGSGSYFTAIRCVKCEYEIGIHEG